MSIEMKIIFKKTFLELQMPYILNRFLSVIIKQAKEIKIIKIILMIRKMLTLNR